MAVNTTAIRKRVSDFLSTHNIEDHAFVADVFGGLDAIDQDLGDKVSAIESALSAPSFEDAKRFLVDVIDVKDPTDVGADEGNDTASGDTAGAIGLSGGANAD